MEIRPMETKLFHAGGQA